MENWEFYFMIGSGIYLIVLGVLMFKSNKKGASKGVGIYNIIVGIASIIAGILGKNISNIGNTIFLVFIVVLVVSFIGFFMLNLFIKKDNL